MVAVVRQKTPAVMTVPQSEKPAPELPFLLLQVQHKLFVA